MRGKIRAKIDFVYFDLGHVVVPVMTDLFIDELAKFSDLSRQEIAGILGHGYDSSKREYWDVICDFDRGTLYPHEFYARMTALLRLHATFEKFAATWQIMLDIELKFAGLLDQLALQGIGRGIISDLCLLHFQRFVKLMPQDYFNIRFFSFMEGRLKKEDDGETFRRAIVAANVKPGRILFIDDRPENLAAASLHGMKTFLYQADFDALARHLRSLSVKVK